MILTPEEAGKIRAAIEFLLEESCEDHSNPIALKNAEAALAIMAKPEPRAMRSADCTTVINALRSLQAQAARHSADTMVSEALLALERIQADALASVKPCKHIWHDTEDGISCRTLCKLCGADNEDTP